MSSEQIRQQKRNSAVQTVLTVTILLFTAIQIPLSSYFNSLSAKLQLELGLVISVFFSLAIYFAFRINKTNLVEVYKNEFQGEKLSSKVEK